ncbi:hypothetical protein MJT46_010500 [Ovis ammon polii x Ovis aries]|nr:hypothetical protein MJT46_010500 [Ovis ammon polii x Ovis aries]
MPGPGRFHMPRSDSACQPRLLKPERLQPALTAREAAAQRNLCTAVKNSLCAPQPEKAHSNEDLAHPKEKEKSKELLGVAERIRPAAHMHADPLMPLQLHKQDPREDRLHSRKQFFHAGFHRRWLLAHYSGGDKVGDEVEGS